MKIMAVAFVLAMAPGLTTTQVIRFKVTSSDRSSIKHLQICAKGNRPCSNGLTDASGYVEMQIPLHAKPGEPITLDIPNLPKDMVVISPRELRSFIPATDRLDGFIEIEIERKRDGQALRSEVPSRKIVQALNEQRAKNIVQKQPKAKGERQIKGRLAKQLEVPVSDIDKATASFLILNKDLIDAGEAAYYKDHYRTSARLLRKGLNSPHSELSLNDEAHAWNLLGSAELEINNLEAALEALRRAYILNPAHAEYIIDYVSILSLFGHVDEALSIADNEMQKPASLFSQSDKFALRVLIAQNDSLLLQHDLTAIATQLVNDSKHLADWQKALGLCTAAQIDFFSGNQDTARELVKVAAGIELDEGDEDEFSAKASCLVADALLSEPEVAVNKLRDAKKIFSEQEAPTWSVDLILGRAYLAKDEYSKAESIFRGLYTDIKDNNGEKTIIAASAALGLADALAGQDRSQEALEVLASAFNATRALDALPMLKAVAMYHKGRYLANIGRNKEAVQVILEAQNNLHGSGKYVKKILLDSYNSLITAYSGQRDYANAERACKEALKLINESDKEELWIKARLLNHLGATYNYTRRYREADAIFKEAYELLQRIAGSSVDREVAENWYYQGQLARSEGRNSDALKLFQRAFEIETEVLKPDSLSRAETERELGETEYDLYRFADASRHLTHVRKIQGRVYGKDDWRTFNVRIFEAWIAFYVNDFVKAQTLAQDLYVLVKKLPAYRDYPTDLADLLILLTDCRLELRDIPGAKKLSMDALQLSWEYKEPQMQMRSWLLQARVELADKNGEAAAEWTGRALDKCQADDVSFRVRCAFAKVLRARAAGLSGDLDGAFKWVQDAIGTYRNNHSDLAPELADAYVYLADLLHKSGDFAGEKQALAVALEIREHDFGQDHSLTAEVRMRINALGN